MIYIIILIGILIIIGMIYGILISISIIPVSNCKCGGKYYSNSYSYFLDKNIYKCNKCNKEVF